MYVTTDPLCVKHILKDNFNNWTKDGETNILFNLLRKWLGKGIFTVRHGTEPELVPEHQQWNGTLPLAANIP
jgi:hypothetical protein